MRRTVLGALAILVGGMLVCRGDMAGGADDNACQASAAAQDWRAAAVRCEAVYRKARRPSDGVLAARALLRTGMLDAAARLARPLIASARVAEAWLVLGEVAARRGDADASGAAYHQALRAYVASADDAGASRAALGVAGSWRARGQLARAMAAQQQAAAFGERAGDATLQLYATMGRAALLREQGLLVAAEQTLERGAGQARSPREQAWLALERGIVYVELELDALARTQLDAVLAIDPPPPSDLALAAHLNLAWIDRRAGAFAPAARHIDAAAAIDAEDVDVRINRARVLADQQQLDAAAAELAQAARSNSDTDAAWWIAYNEALIAQRRARPAEQLGALRRAIEGVRALSSGGGRYAPDIAASHRQPYLQLVGVHARAAAWRDVLGLVMELEALALLSTELPPSGSSPRTAPPTPGPPAATLPPIDAVLAAWRGRRLEILVSDEDVMWRLELRDGQLTGTAVGAARTLESMARRLEANPIDTEAADVLGAAIIPTEIADDSVALASMPAVVDILLIGPIARAPLAGLTLGGRPIIDRMPLARVLGVVPRPPRRHRPAEDSAAIRDPRRPRDLPDDGPGARAQDSVVIGDPRGDLPDARAEAIAVSAQLGVLPQLGNAATRRALAKARGAGLLHVAAHVIHAEEPALALADGDVGVTELAAAGDGAPVVVVLMSCGGAVARDDSGWGSLAASYLAAGSEAVIAAAWSVDDAATRQLAVLLYREPVRGQPALALARAQRAGRALLPPRVWAGFTVISAPPAFSM